MQEKSLLSIEPNIIISNGTAAMSVGALTYVTEYSSQLSGSWLFFSVLWNFVMQRQEKNSSSEEDDDLGASMLPAYDCKSKRVVWMKSSAMKRRRILLETSIPTDRLCGHQAVVQQDHM